MKKFIISFFRFIAWLLFQPIRLMFFRPSYGAGPLALIKLGTGIAAISGKVGGSVFSRNKGGAYVKSWVKPTNPNTTPQQAVRTRLSNLSQGWRSLTQGQRDAWNGAATTFPYVNRLGEIIHLQGEALYIKLNLNILAINQTEITVPPLPTAVDAPLTLTTACSDGAGTMTLTFTDVIPAATTWQVFATPQLSAGITNVDSYYRQIDLLVNGDLTGIDIATEYTAKYGALPALGARYGIKIRAVLDGSGIPAAPRTALAIVAA